MMDSCYSLFLKARFCSEIMERILRVVRHRGFQLHTLNMISYDNLDEKKISVFLIVSSEKSIKLLFSQLNKLVDVIYVEIQ